MAGNVFFFAAGPGENWAKTIARAVDLEGLGELLGPELVGHLSRKAGSEPLYAWGAPSGAVGTIAGMSEDDVVFGSRRGVVGFGGQVALSLKEPSDGLSTALWGAPKWPYVYFLHHAVFGSRPVPEFLAYVGERGRLIQGFRVSHRASRLLRSVGSASEFIRAALVVPAEAAAAARPAAASAPAPAHNLVDERGHAEAQADLVRMGESLGLSVWVAANDRSRTVRDYVFREHTLEALPFQGQPEFHRRIELIDVLWLQQSAIRAAFEVEHSTQVYSGLLRMGDLVAQFPSLSFPLFIVAPDADKRRVCAEINRPAFRANKLSELCRFIPYSRLRDAVLETARFGRRLDPSVIYDYAEPCGS